MVISTVNQVVYNGDGITTAWPYTFRIIDATDIKLTIVDADGAETQVTADYYVDTINNTVYYPGYAPGAEPPEADQPPKLQEGQKIIVYRQLPVNQLANLGEKWPFSVIEKGLDKLTMLIQDVWGWVSNNVINRVGDAWDALGLPIHNVGGPVNLQDAATKDYVDRILSGIIASGDGRVVPFDNVAQLIDADAVAGQIAATLGYHDISDGGAGVYNIRTKTPYDVEDGGSVIFLDNGNVAELITDGTVNVKQFGAYGDGTHDDTTAIQNAVTAGSYVYIPSGTYMVDGTKFINLHSNMTLLMDGDATLKCIPNDQGVYSILIGSAIFNVNIIGGNIVGERDEHIGSTGEWGFGINLSSCENVVIENVNCSDCWGDGIYIGGNGTAPSKNIVIENCVCDNNRRQGISVISVDGLSINNCVLKNTNGTSPQCGIDFEPNGNDYILNNIQVNNLHTFGNHGGGVIIAVNIPHIDITINGWFNDSNSANTISIDSAGFRMIGNAKTGQVVANDVITVNDYQHAVLVNNHYKGAALVFNNLTIHNPNRSKNANAPHGTPLFISGHPGVLYKANGIVGDVYIKDVSITHTDDSPLPFKPIMILGAYRNAVITCSDICIDGIRELSSFVSDTIDLRDCTDNIKIIDKYNTMPIFVHSYASDISSSLYSPLYQIANADRYASLNEDWPVESEITWISSSTYNTYIVVADGSPIYPYITNSATHRLAMSSGLGKRVTLLKKSDGWYVTNVVGTVTVEAYS